MRRIDPCRGSVIPAAIFMILSSCGPRPQAPPPPAPYTPSYTYNGAATQVKQDVTIAVMSPVVNGSVYGVDGAQMLSSMPSAFADLITAKGMRFRGPFTELEEMTFPDKRESDLGVYVDLQANVGWTPRDVRHLPADDAWGLRRPLICDVNLTANGKATFIAIEPLSNETLWRKTVPVDVPAVFVQGVIDYRVCSAASAAWTQGPAAFVGQPSRESAAPALEGEFGNAYRRMLEAVFVLVMKGVDKYVNAEEFALLKTQAAELKTRKEY